MQHLRNCRWHYRVRPRPSFSPHPIGRQKFSYCLLSHLFDETNKSSSVVLSVERTPSKTKGVSYTPFVKNPEVPGRGHFLTSYYVGLRRITVGGRSVKISYRYLRPDKNSSGGTIVDSRTTFTYMAPGVRVHGGRVREVYEGL
ncbi:Eukaryotic aspartyl protease family protein [Prunus dulcis]|uniref:Eukaryotic aspartyl protease family protein n=1 Tax=Prunus dulcis TaxID=3755 RepID=A0A4Y1RNR6_PRUDU|nr:Eukaryotic aspartyl protease family protein [Prunus dulcis]